LGIIEWQNLQSKARNFSRWCRQKNTCIARARYWFQTQQQDKQKIQVNYIKEDVVRDKQEWLDWANE
jgi:hypothetical protein